MAQNQCELTPEGQAVLDQLLRLVYPQGCTKAGLKRDTGLSRDTLCRILNRPTRSVQYIKLEQLFDRLSQQLDGPSRGQYQFQPRYCREVVESAPLSQSNLPQSHPIASIPFSPQRLVTSFGDLDYEEGGKQFTDSMQRLKPAGAFLLQVNDTKVQRWLVRRLAQQVWGFENCKSIEINLACLGGRVEQLWAEISKKLELPHRTSDAIIASLSELCQEKTVIIVLSRLQQLDPEIQDRLIGEFWFPLVRQIRSQQLHWRSRLVLFLIQDHPELTDDESWAGVTLGGKTVDNSESPVVLQPLTEIPTSEVQHWFEQVGLKLLVEKVGAEAADQFMQSDRISTWPSHPWTMLENICNEFGLDTTDIEPYWKLAG